MLCKDDWDKVKERYRAFYHRELVDRVLIQVAAPSEQAPKTSRNWHKYFVAEHPEEPELIVAEFLKEIPHHFWGGELFPALMIYFGAGSLAAYMGCKLNIRPETIWFDSPGDLSLDDILRLELDPENRWWKATRTLCSELPRLAAGRFLVGITDLNAEMNALGFLRGTERLLIDLIDEPLKVRQAAAKLHGFWLECFEEQYRRLSQYQEGHTWWMQMWSPVRASDLQCDFSAMISPAMFERFVRPDIEDSARKLERTIFHWDGPGQIAHLNILLDIAELDGIQWVPGAGNPGTGSPKWFPLYKRIQEAGKLLVLQGMEPRDIKGVMEALEHRGLLIGTSCETEEEARRLLKKVAKWSR